MNMEITLNGAVREVLVETLLSDELGSVTVVISMDDTYERMVEVHVDSRGIRTALVNTGFDENVDQMFDIIDEVFQQLDLNEEEYDSGYESEYDSEGVTGNS